MRQACRGHLGQQLERAGPDGTPCARTRSAIPDMSHSATVAGGAGLVALASR